MTYPVHISDQKFINSMDLLIISDKINSHYEYIKKFNKFLFNKTKNKKKKYFGNIAYSVLAAKEFWQNIKKYVKKKKGKQTVKLKSGFIEFKNYSRQIPAPFKIYANFEYILKNV